MITRDFKRFFLFSYEICISSNLSQCKLVVIDISLKKFSQIGN